MRNISEIMPVAKRNESQIYAVPKSELIKLSDSEIKFINNLFKELMIICPVMSSDIKNDKGIGQLKKQWSLGFIENGMINQAITNAGLSYARKLGDKFFPTFGQFIQWCDLGLAERYKLPKVDDLLIEFERYRAAKGFDDFHEFKYLSNAYFWLLNDLYYSSVLSGLTVIKLREKAQELISSMARQLMFGYVIPEPEKALPKTVNKKPLTRDQQLSKVCEIKRKFGFSYASQKTTAAS